MLFSFEFVFGSLEYYNGGSRAVYENPEKAFEQLSFLFEWVTDVGFFEIDFELKQALYSLFWKWKTNLDKFYWMYECTDKRSYMHETNI